MGLGADLVRIKGKGIPTKDCIIGNVVFLYLNESRFFCGHILVIVVICAFSNHLKTFFFAARKYHLFLQLCLPKGFAHSLSLD